jgi:16S rRNA (cytidine1402-2'-O)-methyltransferase
MPAIADPGSSVVRAAHAIGLPVAPLVGPVSLMLALAASGLNGQNFAFVGYLPQDQNERAKQIKALQSHVLQSRQTQIFIETPYRNAALLNALLQHLSGNIRLSVSSGLTMKKMSNRCMSVSEWKQSGQTAPDKDTPAVYMIGV